MGERLVLLAVLGVAGGARADGTNPYHLEANVVSPFDYTGVVTSTTPGHHVVFDDTLARVGGGRLGVQQYP